MQSTNTVSKLPEAFYDNRLLSTAQTQEMLGVSRVTLFKMLHRKNDPLPSYRVGRLRKCKLDELVWWISKHQV
jgi:excisionase family DNA binding protein